MKKGVMDNMLFHGSEHADLPYIKANAKSHTTGKEVAYGTLGYNITMNVYTHVKFDDAKEELSRLNVV